MKEESYLAYGVFFETLANQNRLRIINALRGGDKNVSSIIAATGLEQTCVSHCLARLERCGFVAARREGKFKVYTLNRQTIEPLMALIDKHTCAHCIHLIGADGAAAKGATKRETERKEKQGTRRARR